MSNIGSAEFWIDKLTDRKRVLSATGAGVWVEFPLVGCIESCLVFIWDAVDSSILCARVLSATGAGVWIEFCSGGCVEFCLVIVVVVVLTWEDVDSSILCRVGTLLYISRGTLGAISCTVGTGVIISCIGCCT